MLHILQQALKLHILQQAQAPPGACWRQAPHMLHIHWGGVHSRGLLQGSCQGTLSAWWCRVQSQRHSQAM